MLFRDKVALNLPPLLLRVLLAVTFIWAGAGKLQPTTFEGDQAVRLLEMKVVPPIAGTVQNEEQPAPEEESGEGESQDPPAESEGEVVDSPTDTPIIPPADGVQARSLHNITLMIDSATTPDDNGATLLPAWMGQGRAVAFAWLATIAELAGGALVLLGLFTRIWSVALAGTMVMALWITQIGPVVVLGQPGWLGFLPAIDGFAVAAWQVWLWQFSLLMASGALFFLGAGGISLDRMLFPRPRTQGETSPAAPES